MTVQAAPRDLVTHLMELSAREDRAALAALRRGLGSEPGATPEMYPHVEPYIPAEAGRVTVAAAYLVASLYGLHPVHQDSETRSWARRGLGASLRALRRPPGQDEDDPGATRRFIALLNCSRDALPHHLRGLVTLLRSRTEMTPIDFRQLRRDILDWEHEDRRVQRAWASGFWEHRPETSSEEQSANPPGDPGQTP